MPMFASVALFRRNGQMTYRPPVKRSHENVTQARKSAARLWNDAIRAPDKLHRIIVVARDGKGIHISEKVGGWTEATMHPAEAAKQPHLAACLKELGIDPNAAPPPMPDVLEINGVIYRREI